LTQSKKSNHISNENYLLASTNFEKKKFKLAKYHFLEYLKKNDDFNLLIRIKDDSFQKNKTYDQVLKDINSIFNDNFLSKYEKTNDQNYSLLFKLKNVNKKKINELEKKLSLNVKNLEFYFFDDTDQTI